MTNELEGPKQFFKRTELWDSYIADGNEKWYNNFAR